MSADSDAPRERSTNETLREDDPSFEGQRVLAHVMTGLFGGDAAGPVRIGRFVVLRRLGAGGMGEVFAGYDAELDRKVAIKLLRARSDATLLQARLRREAQAIAKLAHPNVVAIFEVGEDGGRLFLVMEMVEGTTLRVWLQQPRRRDAILDVFEQAGRGLVAAHSAGLVHRDLKPDNILVGHDGRVRLVDFGLARTDAAESNDASALASTADSGLAGTPRYMAPEQFRGAHVDHRADQFAFCVSLYEALYGAPPFAGRSVPELADKVLRGAADPPPRDRGVPSGLARLLRRGLATEPTQRFADMQALLDELARARAAPRRRALAAALVLAAGGAAAWVTVEHSAELACRDEGEHARTSWHDAQPQLAAALRATGVSFAEQAIARIEPALARRTEDWAAARTASCRARHRDPDDEMIARADACLDERMLEQTALIDVLAAANATVATTAVQAVASLPPVDACTEIGRLARRPPPPDPTQRQCVDALAPAMAEIGARTTAGRWAEAHAAALALLPAVASCGHAPQHAELLRRLGDTADRVGDLPAAETHLRAAYFLAGEHGLDHTAAQAAISLVTTVGVHGQRNDDGSAWIEHAAMMAARVDDPQVQIDLRRVRGGVLLERGAYDEATALLAEALALAEAQLGPSNPAIGVDVISLGSAYSMSGAAELAKTTLERARTLVADGLGPGHPLVAAALHNLANLAGRQGQWADAAALHREALAIREAVFRGDNIETASSIAGIGGALASMGDVAGGEAHFRRALAMLERVLGPEHPRLVFELDNLGVALMMQDRIGEALALFERACRLVERGTVETTQHARCNENLGDVLHELGRNAEATARYRRALAIHERTAGADHPETAKVRMNLAMVLSAAGENETALPLYVQAHDALVKALPAEHVLVAEARLSLGRARERVGDHAGAIETLERALAVAGEEDARRSEVRLWLAKALWGTGERARAISEGRAALQGFTALGEPAVTLRDETAAWLAAR